MQLSPRFVGGEIYGVPAMAPRFCFKINTHAFSGIVATSGPKHGEINGKSLSTYEHGVN